MPLVYPPFKSCPCGSGRSYGHCCGPLHAGRETAGTPEQLMRARYTAFALGDTAFLLATWHPDHRPGELEVQRGTRYLGLRIHEAQGNEVEFSATLKLADREKYVLKERSLFGRCAGQWVYVNDVAPPILEADES